MSATPVPAERDDLVDREIVLRFLLSAAFWLVFAPTIGVILSIKFNYPDFLGGIDWLTWGRLRPVHVMGVIFGAFTTACHRTDLLHGAAALRRAHVQGELEPSDLLALEPGIDGGPRFRCHSARTSASRRVSFPLWANVLVEIVLVLITIQVVGTVYRRNEKRIYVTLWYLTAAYIWTVFNYFFGHFILPYSMPGVNNAAMHGLYIHYVVGLWITPAGLAIIYYFLPLAARRSAVQPQALADRLLVARILLPVRRDAPLHLQPDPVLDPDDRDCRLHDADHPGLDGDPEFLRDPRRQLEALPGVLHGQVPDRRRALLPHRLLPGLDRGAARGAEAHALHGLRDRALAPHGLRDVHPLGDGGMYYVIPRLSGHELYSRRLAQWHYWLTVAGFSLMAAVLTLQGLLQGTMLQVGTDFVDSMAR